MTRHKKVHKDKQTKHDDTGDVDKIITQDVIINLFNEVRENAVENKCYGEEIRKELKKDKTDLALLNAYKVPYKKFVKNGDVEQFYTYCYSNIIVNSDTYLSTYSQHAGTLLLLKLTDRLIVFAKNASRKHKTRTY